MKTYITSYQSGQMATLAKNKIEACTKFGVRYSQVFLSAVHIDLLPPQYQKIK